MQNNYIKHSTKNQKNDLLAQRNACLQKEESFKAEAQTLGFSNFTLEQILYTLPDGLDQEKASRLITLQDDYRKVLDEKERLWIEDHVVDELNEIHGVVHVDQTMILTEKKDLFGRQSFSLESKQSFKNYYENKLVRCFDGKERSKAEIWLKSDRRREFPNGITFNPKVIGHVDGAYNIWKGFTREVQKGDCSLYWNHVRDNICAKNSETYKYVRKWVASIFQKPDVLHTALVLQGSQGVGKNSFVEPLGELLGQHYSLLCNMSELVSNFNFHLKNAVLIHANEALWGGHKQYLGTIKAMITENVFYIEAKGKDRIAVRSHRHLIMSSNESWPVFLDRDCRRFVVLAVSDEQKENRDYFAAIIKQLENGGYEALLYDLLNEDLKDFDPSKFPHSLAAFAIKMRSADSADQYIYEALRVGCFYLANEYEDKDSEVRGVWQPYIPKADVYADYKTWCMNNGHQGIHSNKFGETLKRLIPSIADCRPAQMGKRIYSYVLPDLEAAREEFCRAFKVSGDIWNEGLDKTDSPDGV